MGGARSSALLTDLFTPLPTLHKGGRCAIARRLTLGVPRTKTDV